MGLSTRERTGKILYSVCEIIEKVQKLKELPDDPNDGRLKRLISYCDNLWPTLLGGDRNPSHWLLGSSTSNLVKCDNEDLWSVAICSSLPTVSNGKLLKVVENDYDDWHPLRDMLGISNFLHHAYNSELKYVYEIYQLIEEIIYALRRYNDEYLSDKKAFSDLTANIQGTCFSLFNKSNDLSCAYIAHQICSILYARHHSVKDGEPYQDVVDEWLHETHIHHQLTAVVGRLEKSIEWLVEQHLILIGSKDVELKKNRVLVALRMCGRRFHEDYAHEGLLEILTKDKDLQDKAFMESVAKELLACKEAKKEDKESSSKEYENENRPSMLYGYWD